MLQLLSSVSYCRCQRPPGTCADGQIRDRLANPTMYNSATWNISANYISSA